MTIRMPELIKAPDCRLCGWAGNYLLKVEGKEYGLCKKCLEKLHDLGFVERDDVGGFYLP